MIEKLYNFVVLLCQRSVAGFTPYARRIVRGLALPYCYFVLVDWKECSASRFQVVKDLLYIFFVLKYFPDNYSLCRLWEKDRKEWKYYYASTYDPYQRGRLRKEVIRKEYEVLYEDKQVCYELCKAADLPLPQQFGCVAPGEDYKAFFRRLLEMSPGQKLIVKSTTSMGGKDIYLVFREGDKIYVRDTVCSIPLDDFTMHATSVVQEYVLQHEKLSSVCPSTNTIRVATLLTRENEALIVAALIRFGVGSAFIDNTSQGGVAVGIAPEKGVLLEKGYNFKNQVHYRHPTANIVFAGFTVPFWDDVLDLAKKTHKALPYCKLIGHDIAVTPSGPVLIEVNSIYDNVGLEMCCGPILAKPQILQEFKRYGLLVNNLL